VGSLVRGRQNSALSGVDPEAIQTPVGAGHGADDQLRDAETGRLHVFEVHLNPGVHGVDTVQGPDLICEGNVDRHQADASPLVEPSLTTTVPT
jgi:hypothetical protein